MNTRLLKQLEASVNVRSINSNRRHTLIVRSCGCKTDSRGRTATCSRISETCRSKDVEDADWSLTPGRFVGVAPPEPDDDFDFEQTIRDIHTELADLHKEAVELAAKIEENFEELGYDVGAR